MKQTTVLPTNMMKLRRKNSGFTFIEILVVTIIIGILASVVMVSYVNTSRLTRDSRRKKDLANLQAALEIYKANTGSYPDHISCASSATWPGCGSPWIPGLDDNYVSEMPSDPKENVTGFIGNGSADTYTYNYIQISPSSYRLLARLENANDASINGSQYGYSGVRIYVVPEPR
jgi:general secretion pathway protein G